VDQLLREMTPRERAEVEAFAAFIIARRNLKEPQVLTQEMPIEELMELVTRSGSFDWLEAEDEDIYSIQYGEAAQWPTAP
jgi:hypothetical protein